MAVLYRKYRPQTFSEVLNQKYIIQTLQNQVIQGSVAHAYLFTGSRGVGKTSIARILAKALNCKNKTDKGDACGVCDFCKQIEANNFVDLVEIDAASNTGVDNIRDLIEHVRFAPTLGKHKVFIIDEVHMLSKGAFNALLKTLEEPPAHAVFVLATTEINKVPATIISRTQRFDFRSLSEADLVNHLQKIAETEGIKIEKNILSLIADASEGSVRDSLSLLGKILTLGSSPSLQDAQSLLGVTDISVCQDLFLLLVQGDAKKIPDFFAEISKKTPDYKILNKDFLEYLRKALVFKVAGQVEGLSPERLESLKNIAVNASINDVMFFIRLFLKSFKDLDSSPSPEIPLLLSSIEAALKKSGVGELGTVKATENLKKAEPVKQNFVENKLKEEINVSQEKSVVADSLNMEEVGLLWPKVIARIKEINGPLSSVLRKAQVLEPENGRIILGVKFLFDKQSIENAKNLSLINESLKAVFSKNISLRADVIKEEKEAVKTTGEMFNQALQVFGGELVE